MHNDKVPMLRAGVPNGNGKQMATRVQCGYADDGNSAIQRAGVYINRDIVMEGVCGLDAGAGAVFVRC